MAWIEPLDLLNAYCEGVFPMGEEDGSVQWYRPHMRGILPIAEFHLPRRFARYLLTHPFEVRWNTSFGDVVRGCADRDSTWINETIMDTYQELHRLGHAHCVEVWRAGRLVGGVYGVAIGGAFFGESMFSRETQASKVALACLQMRLKERGYVLHDTQWTTPHLATFGGHEIPCSEYLSRLDRAIQMPVTFMDGLAPTTLVFR
jgi:leucyl/phenylalanyl-tRNA---protein transferase